MICQHGELKPCNLSFLYSTLNQLLAAALLHLISVPVNRNIAPEQLGGVSSESIEPGGVLKCIRY